MLFLCIYKYKYFVKKYNLSGNASIYLENKY